MQDVFEEFERHQALTVAAEDWASGYKKSPDQYSRMLRAGARLNRVVLQYFRDLADRVNTFVYWPEYEHRVNKVQAADQFAVDVMIEEVIDKDDAVLMRMFYDPIATSVSLGAQSAEELHHINLGVTQSTEFIQRAAKEQVAGLVGKKVDSKGIVKPNPNAEYHINTRTKQDIRESINTSISLGENRSEATSRIQRAIKNQKRADMIAQTETVNAYNDGIQKFGEVSGAVGKEWETTGAVDVCATFAGEGIVPLDHKYTLSSGRQITGPTAHPYCRCFRRLVYQEELDG